ncbi:DUF5979 domain-containing protein [Leucobacter chromiireducens]|uniref:DUF5979 domain-containing protein n=1 Tax=Leucobacter chromiireducens TaxID=283877 RepID=UPI000F643919|nr:DUF5979 domain-containing protein [Leucobacter chromiireducens]
MAVAAPQAAVAADTTAALEVHKFASETQLKPGDTMEYRIEVGCSSITDLGCRDAVLSDLIPAEFEIVPGSVTVSNASSNPPVVDGNQITVEFTDELGDGSVGLVENADAVITVQVKLREDLPYEANGIPIVNTADVEALNAEKVSDQVSVIPNVELKLNTEVSKSYAPDLGQAKPGTSTQLTVTGANTSNAGVDSLTLTDPADPAAAPNPFDLLQIVGVESLDFPEGAATATVEYFIDGAWVAVEVAPGEVPPAPTGDAKGVRVTFVAADGGTIPTNAGGGFVLNLEQRAEVEDLAETTVVNNTVVSEVALGEDTANANNSDDYTIITDPISVGTTKEFAPKTLIEGQETAVTLTGTNTSLTDLDSLSLREPATGDFAEELDFVGFTGAVQFPSAATAGTLTFVYLDTDGVERTFGPEALTDGGTYPALPSDFGSLKHFTFDYTGPITPGGTTEIVFDAKANEKIHDDEGNLKPGVENVVGVTGEKEGEQPATATDDDEVTFEEKTLEIVTEKKLSPEEIWGVQGEGVLVQLPTTVLKPTSNVPATEIVVSDPELSDPSDPNSPPKSSAFWDAFTPNAITNTDVPSGATLTVKYFDTDTNAWVVVPGFDGLTGTVNAELPADILDKIGGLQFVFSNPDPGFEPHAEGEFNVSPNFTATLNETLPAGSDPVDIANCASASGQTVSNGSVIADDETDAPACDDVTIKAPTPGEYDLFAKNWIGAGNPAQIVQRTGDHATTRLSWSTENLSFTNMSIADTRLGKNVAAGPIDPVEQTTFEAFNLHTVKAVTDDEGFTKGWDRITAIELWIGGAWVPATNATGLPYTKTMSDVVLTAAEQRDATGVRVVFEENGDGRTGAGAPPIGSGLTKSRGHDRHVDLEWELRDVRRSDPNTAVIASELFNVPGKEGLVKNWGSATGQQAGGSIENDQDDDDITIVPRPLAVSVTKGWEGGPLGVPPGDVPESSFPTSRVTLKATNESVQKVDQLSILDPGEGTESPFEIFNLRKINSISNGVQGADPAKTLVVLTKADGTIIDPAGNGGLTPGQATALTPAELADVVSIQVTYEGRILSKASATVQMDLQLRKTHRSDPGTLVSVVDSPVKNEATATVTDLLGLAQEHSVDKNGSAQIQINTFELGVSTTKKFTPDTQRVEWLTTEPEYAEEQWDPIRMDLTARPTGTARTGALIVTDSAENRTDDPASAKSFWNTFRFIGFTDDALAVPTPINRVRAEVLYGTFDTPGANKLNFTPDASTPNGDGWVPGSDAAVAVTGGTVENAAATLLANISAADYDKIRGIRLVFERVDADGNALAFENPANPQVQIALDVKRRAYLVSDPAEPVPSSAAAVSAPGEPIMAPGGQFTNTVDADAESFVTFPVEGSDERLPLVASDEAADQAFYLASGIEVAVRKTPEGAQKPGVVIPFKLQTTNTAKVSDDDSENTANAIAEPVIIDRLPIKDGKPQLIFDPDMDPEKRFSYELQNPLPDANHPITVDPAQVTVTYLDANMAEIPAGSADEPHAIQFTFPEGQTSLYPGEVYTITVNMMFRPGVEAGSANSMTNQFSVSSNSEEGFAGCNFTYDEDHPVQECGTSTEVYPTEQGALRGKKYVRANDPELGISDVPNPTSGRACVPQFGESGPAYSVSNCVPVTKPLGVETWREELQNTGTLPMDTVVTIDTLPKVGDQGSVVLLPRGSEWRPTWEGNAALVSDTAPDGTVYRNDVPFTQFFSSSESAACVADLKPTEPQCDGFWQPLTADVDPASVRHVKTVFDFSAEPLAPGGRLAYTFETRTPAVAEKMTADTVAWNTVAVGAQTVATDGTKASVIPTEGIRVGVALATGPLAIEKKVDGAGAQFAPDSFELEVICVVPDREGSEGGAVTLDPVTVTVPNGEPTTLDEQFPWGAKCTVRDVPGANGETSSTESNEVTIGREDETVPVLTLTNTYDAGGFEVSKLVDGATNQDGEAISYGRFPVKVTCTFLGANIGTESAWLTPGDAASKIALDGLPLGTECRVTELDAKGASATLTIDGETVEPVAPGVWDFTIEQPERTIALAVTNTFELGAIEIEKQLAGSAAAAISDDTVFTFAVLCTFEGETVWEGTTTLTKAQATAGTTARVDTLPIGAMCGVTETGTGGATQSVVTPDTGESPVEVGTQEEPLRFTAVNTYDAGSLQVTKEITGDGAELYGTGPFEVSLACTLDGTPIEVPEGAERVLSTETGLAANYPALPLGAECELTETKTGGATSSVIVDAAGDPVTEPVVIGGDEQFELRVINTFDLGAITVEKQITGAGASLADDKVFTVALACTIDRDGTTETIEVPGGAERELSKQGGLTAQYDELPVGAECELRETQTGGAKSVTITPNAGDPAVGAVTVAKDTAATITVVNEFVQPPVVPPTEPPTTPGTKPGGDLPTTGGGSNLGWLIGGGALLLVGAALIALRLRRRGSSAADAADGAAAERSGEPGGTPDA